MNPSIHTHIRTTTHSAPDKSSICSRRTARSSFRRLRTLWHCEGTKGTVCQDHEWVKQQFQVEKKWFGCSEAAAAFRSSDHRLCGSDSAVVIRDHFYLAAPSRILQWVWDLSVQKNDRSRMIFSLMHIVCPLRFISRNIAHWQIHGVFSSWIKSALAQPW